MIMADQIPKSHLERNLARKLNSRKSKSTYRQLTVSPPGSVDFSSNDFLSLSTSPLLRDAFLTELTAQSQRFNLGSSGSRLLDGNSTYADDLERSIASFHNAPAGLLWNSGFDANSGLFACIPQPGDVIVHDELIHASVHDGMRLSRAAKTIAFAHNSVPDLARIVAELMRHDAEIAAGTHAIFIAIESVYSMDGDLAPLAEIVQLVDTLLPAKNGHIIIDEAHGTGVLGPLGRGLVSALGLEHKVFARLHTFGKSLACSGAIVLCSPLVRAYLINYARPFLYTTFMPFPSLAAIRASYSLLQRGLTAPLALHLTSLIRLLHAALRGMMARHPRRLGDRTPPLLGIAEACPASPIFSLATEHPRSLAKHCQDGGFVVRAIVPPTVATRRVRVCLHAGNSVDEVERLAERIEEWVMARMKADRVENEEGGLVKASL
jgi:8-amino-7-oxononanoate synthase